MTLENLRGIEESAERLRPGYKLLFSGPATMIAYTFIRSELTGDDDQSLRLIAEYHTIFNTLCNTVGRENLVVADAPVITAKHTIAGLAVREFRVPTELNFGAVPIPFFHDDDRLWPRDAYTVFQNRLLIYPDVWYGPLPQDQITAFSLLGEGGKVLTRLKALLVTEDIWQSSDPSLVELRSHGMRIAPLPFVDQSKQKYTFPLDHIDGHALLVETKRQGLLLAVSKSYYYQGKNSSGSIRKAADTISARLTIVDDRNLPFLAFNLIQLYDGTVVMTGPRNNQLTVVLGSHVKRVITTDTPITLLPQLTSGSLRCMTNDLSPSMQQLIRTSTY